MHSAKWCLSGYFRVILNQKNLLLNLSLQYRLHGETPFLKTIDPLLHVFLYSTIPSCTWIYKSRKGRDNWEQTRGSTIGNTPAILGRKIVESTMVFSHKGWELPHLIAIPHLTVLLLALEASENMRLPSWAWFTRGMLVSSSQVSGPENQLFLLPRGRHKPEMQVSIMCTPLTDSEEEMQNAYPLNICLKSDRRHSSF